MRDATHVDVQEQVDEQRACKAGSEDLDSTKRVEAPRRDAVLAEVMNDRLDDGGDDDVDMFD